MDFQKLIDYRNNNNPFCQRLGIILQELSTGYAKVKKTVTPDDCNPLGVPHGGLYFTMADNACGCAMSTSGYVAVTISADYSFLRSAKVGDTLTAEAHSLKNGRTVNVYEARISDQDGTLLGVGTFTFFKTDTPIEL